MKKKDKLKEVEEFLEKHKISGIIRIPEHGTFSMFANQGDKLSILEHAKIELELLKELRKNEVCFRVDEENYISKQKNKNKKIPIYV